MGKGLGILTVLIILFVISSYTLWNTIQNNYSAPEILRLGNYTPTVDVKGISYDNESGLQFYDNMRFDHKDLTFGISPECDNEQTNNMISAMEFLKKQVRNITFRQEIFKDKENNTDIRIYCGEAYKDKENLYVAGEGGPDYIIRTTTFNIIKGGKIVLYRESCSYNVELHELLHVFGLKHSENKKSILFPESFCDQHITMDIVEELRRLYSIEPLPDLYFENITATKHGIYVDLFLTVKNQGIRGTEQNITLGLYSEDKKLTEFVLGPIDYGSGRVLRTENTQLRTRSTTEIRLVIDSENVTKEYSKENNEITLRV